jgi:glyoxylase-like metal-dependent hydrolase (beta-lactamase superfamily II)
MKGTGGWLERVTLVCHCLVVESADGLVLVDTGFGREDVEKPSRLGRPFNAMTSPRLDPAETAIAQVQALGFDAGDVKHIVTTHLDLDHTGGLPDFPLAQVHVLGSELDAALKPDRKGKVRYLPSRWQHGPSWVRHAVAGDEWKGFGSVRLIPDSATEILLIPLAGHSAGHAGVAVRRGDGWLLHCGDAYFDQREVHTPPFTPRGVKLMEIIDQVDGAARRENLERLRELANREGDGVELICSHDAETFPS